MHYFRNLPQKGVAVVLLIVSTLVFSSLLNTRSFAAATNKKPSVTAKKKTAKPTKPSPPEKKTPQKKALLWKISSSQGYFYLTGTIHVGRADFYPLPTKMIQAFEKADTLVVEADITNAANAFLISPQQFLPEGETLSDWLSPELTNTLAEEAEKRNFPVATLLTMKPVMAGITLTMLTLAQAGYQAEYGIDRYLIEQAKNTGKTLIELEGMPAQLSLLDSFSSSEQKSFLTSTLQEVQTGKVTRDFNRMVQAWKTANLAGIETYAQEAEHAYPEAPKILEKMIWGRHSEMLKQLTTLFSEEKIAFVAIGALHLTGENGLLKLLQQAGYQVEPLND